MTELQREYLDISRELTNILDDIKMNLDKYPDYLGSADLNSPIIEEPDILFIGINPGPGRFKQWNDSNWDKKKNRLIDPTKKVIPPDSKNPWRTHLQWLTSGNAREGEWWDNNESMKNYYSYYMCELLVKIYRHDYPNISRKKLTDIFESKVMDTNLFPMSTFSTLELSRLISDYKREKHINIKEVCHRHTMDLIRLVRPHSLVLLGSAVHNVISEEVDSLNIPYYCINRAVGWHAKNNILKIANEIHEMIINHK